jgi:hypothetical protein
MNSRKHISQALKTYPDSISAKQHRASPTFTGDLNLVSLIYISGGISEGSFSYQRTTVVARENGLYPASLIRLRTPERRRLREERSN